MDLAWFLAISLLDRTRLLELFYRIDRGLSNPPLLVLDLLSEKDPPSLASCVPEFRCLLGWVDSFGSSRIVFLGVRFLFPERLFANGGYLCFGWDRRDVQCC